MTGQLSETHRAIRECSICSRTRSSSLIKHQSNEARFKTWKIVSAIILIKSPFPGCNILHTRPKQQGKDTGRYFKQISCQIIFYLLFTDVIARDSIRDNLNPLCSMIVDVNLKSFFFVFSLHFPYSTR